MKLPLTLLLAVTLIQLNAQQKLFDQPVQLKSCNISIKADAFVAKTFVEMEFYNPGDHEVEGYQQFELNAGQAITAFQLELNGKYRDGSIEDRWKANRAYSTIVGKRVDPAILEMDYGNHYRIHVYPVPAHGSRKVTMTISQQMKEDSTRVTYDLPLNFPGYTNSFHISITADSKGSIPFFNKGLLQELAFGTLNDKEVFEWETNNIQLNKPVSFSIPFRENIPIVCISRKNGRINFQLRLIPPVPQYYKVKPRSVAVFWDVSLSAASKNLGRELDFLEKYLVANDINNATITLFNHQLLNTLNYSADEKNFAAIKNYLLNYKYTSATVLGNLDLAAVKADAILFFSDGQNTFGKSLPTAATVQVNCIVSAARFNRPQLEKIIGATGGTLIDLTNSTVTAAINKIELAENFLFGYHATSNDIHIDQSFPIHTGRSVFLSGTISGPVELQLSYGNSNATTKTVSVLMDTISDCTNDDYSEIRLLQSYNTIMNNYYQWQDMVAFGIKENVVTPQTSFLVLERVEDYIKYNIAPPKELVQQCADMNYVYRSEYKLQGLKSYSEQELLQPTVSNYNRRIQWWDKNAAMIDLSKPIIIEATQGDKLLVNKNTESSSTASSIKGTQTRVGATAEPVASFASGSLSEVVVTALGISRQVRSIGYSSQVIRTEELTRAKVTNIASGMSGKVAGLEVRVMNSSVKPETHITLRGSRSIMGNNQALLVVDGVEMPMSYLSVLNPNDVETINVLKGGAASALYGSDASNGVVIVTNKTGTRTSPYGYWGRYKLSSVDDEDYLQEIRNASYNKYWDAYLALEKENKDKPGFYFDMADFFFEKGEQANALQVLYSAAEKSNGSAAGLKAVAYTLESWKKFNDAIMIYKNILEQNNDDQAVKRDLALAYFQNRDYQLALDTYYAIITKEEFSTYINGSLKEIALSEMNALIALHSDSLDLTGINLRLVRPLPVDLRISIEGNNGLNNFQVQEPGGEICNADNPHTISGGHLNIPANDYYYFYDGKNDYSIRNAAKGKYRVITNAYDAHAYDGSPQFLRMVIFRNYQKPNQSIEIKNIILDNQYGEVEIGDVKW